MESVALQLKWSVLKWKILDFVNYLINFTKVVFIESYCSGLIKPRSSLALRSLARYLPCEAARNYFQAKHDRLLLIKKNDYPQLTHHFNDYLYFMFFSN
ncbi:MAG: hypothetical protein Q7U47_14490 [Paludibacter sp.]|nr:hypothetical protein [Paludibacter sp.]